MRIIAGEFSSRKLETRKGDATRPTLDKVREAVFSSLGGSFSGGNMLDLYAGSGACGFEGLSRGCNHVWLVDASREAISVIRKNAETLHCIDRTDILPMKDFRALDALSQKGIRFDLVYLDPPYAKQKNEQVMQYMLDHEMLNEGARVVVESLKEDVFAESVGDLVRYKEAMYGISKISYYRYK